MLPFEWYNPTKIIFGVNSYSKIKDEIPPDARLLITSGGKSVHDNGIYAEVKSYLSQSVIEEFSGIEPNPSIETLREAITIIKEKNINYILAIGGGSVIDATKFLAAAANYDGDAWEILKAGKRVIEALPFATVLTLPATGSENNSGAVISNKSTKQKLGMGGPGLFPKVSFLNPKVVKSIPRNQKVNGILDAFTHVLEQYLTYPIGAKIQDRFSEGILLSLIEISPKLLEDTYDEDTASNFMWSCSMALNGLIGKGVPTDWSTHIIGHELTANYGIDHALTLAIIFPNLYRVKFDDKKDKLAQYAERVWNVRSGTIEDKAELGLVKTIEFIESLGVKRHLADYTSDYQNSGIKVKEAISSRGIKNIGERNSISMDDVEKIVVNSH